VITASRLAGMTKLELEICNDPNELTEASGCVRDLLAREGVDDRAVYAVDLALEELVGNTIKHGYPDDGVHAIRILIEVDERSVRLVLTDDARPFDPTSHPGPPIARSLEETGIGGRGILMVKRLVPSMRYRRNAERNELSLSVRRASSR
jgi:anti-sigma regulatory factor (Ser/Thr protein kinase)